MTVPKSLCVFLVFLTLCCVMREAFVLPTDYDIQDSSELRVSQSLEYDGLDESVDEQEESLIDVTDKIETILDNKELLSSHIAQGLGIQYLPDSSKMNVSEEEFDRKYQLYLRTLEESRRIAQEDPIGIDDYTTPSPTDRWYSTLDTGYIHHKKRENTNSAVLSYFDISSSLNETTSSDEMLVTSAKLRVFRIRPEASMVIPSPIRSSKLPVLTVSLLLTPYDHTVVSKVTLDQRLVLPSKTASWEEFDVTKAVEVWLEKPSYNYGLEIRCEDCSEDGLQIVKSGSEHPELAPLLDFAVRRKREHQRERRSRIDDLFRSQRNKNDCANGGKSKKCCRHSMKISFKELKGFDFILQPKEFDAYVCKGKCPARYNPAHDHAVLQSLVSLDSSRKKVPKPCCAPSKLEGLSVLHMDEHDPTKLRVTYWKDVIVTECACS